MTDTAPTEIYTLSLHDALPILQYILHEAWFCGMKLFVDKNVLIPRPETEELVEWIVSSPQPQLMNKLLDVGTGDRKSTRLNSSHSQISYAVFCLKKKTQQADRA